MISLCCQHPVLLLCKWFMYRFVTHHLTWSDHGVNHCWILANCRHTTKLRSIQRLEPHLQFTTQCKDYNVIGMQSNQKRKTNVTVFNSTWKVNLIHFQRELWKGVLFPYESWSRGQPPYPTPNVWQIIVCGCWFIYWMFYFLLYVLFCGTHCYLACPYNCQVCTIFLRLNVVHI